MSKKKIFGIDYGSPNGDKSVAVFGHSDDEGVIWIDEMKEWTAKDFDAFMTSDWVRSARVSGTWVVLTGNVPLFEDDK